MQTVLLFALPEEYAVFKRLTGPWQLGHRRPFKTFLHTTPFHELLLVETGMGQKQLVEALSWLLARTRPDLMIAAGFGGSLSGDLAVGDVCLGEIFSCHEKAGAGTWDGAAGKWDSRPSVTFHLQGGADPVARVMQVCSEHRFHRTRMVTVGQPQPKPLLARRFADRTSLMDMESYFAVGFCCEREVPLLAVRAVSDGLRDEIDFELAAISDAQGRVSIPLVLASVMRSPNLIRSYFRSWRRSQTAARSLGRALAGLLALPLQELQAIAKSISYCRT